MPSDSQPQTPCTLGGPFHYAALNKPQSRRGSLLRFPLKIKTLVGPKQNLLTVLLIKEQCSHTSLRICTLGQGAGLD